MSMLHTVNKSPFEKTTLDSCLRFAQEGSAILLIEDEEGDALLFRIALEEAGFSSPHLVEANSLANATDALQRDVPFDVVCTDLRLPDARDEEVIEGLRRHTEAPLVLVTGRHPEFIDDTVRGAVIEVVGKRDLNGTTLRRAIERALHSVV